VVTAFPPPMSRQARPRSESFVVQAVSEKIAPPKGADGPGLRPAPPQAVVPTRFVVTRWAKLGVVVVVLVLVVVVVVLSSVVVVVVLAWVVVVVGGVVSVVVVVVGASVVVVGALVVVVGGEVVVLAQGFGSHVPGPRFAPPALEHCVAVSTRQVKAPIGEPGTQHWIGGSVVVVVVVGAPVLVLVEDVVVAVVVLVEDDVLVDVLLVVVVVLTTSGAQLIVTLRLPASSLTQAAPVKLMWRPRPRRATGAVMKARTSSLALR